MPNLISSIFGFVCAALTLILTLPGCLRAPAGCVGIVLFPLAGFVGGFGVLKLLILVFFT